MSANEEIDSSEPMVLSDLVNRVLDKGAVITGHVIVSVAGIDLLLLDLRLLLTSIESALRRGPVANTPVLPDPERGP
jgi:Gas vesicle protein